MKSSHHLISDSKRPKLPGFSGFWLISRRLLTGKSGLIRDLVRSEGLSSGSGLDRDRLKTTLSCRCAACWEVQYDLASRLLCDFRQ